MKVIDFTNQWLAGEVAAGRCMLIMGIIAIVAAIVFWRMPDSPVLRALVIPIAVVGLLHAGTGAFMLYSTDKQKTEYTVAAEQDEAQFLQAEKERVAGFGASYTGVIIFCAIAFVAALLMFALCSSLTWRSVAVVIVYFCLSLLVGDLFSKHHAQVYQQQLETYVQ